MDKNRIIKKITGKNLSLDSEVSIYYLVQRGLPYIVGLLRGAFRRVGLKHSGKKLFLGKNVKLLSKNNISFGNNVRIDSNTTIDALSKKGIIFKDNVKIGEYSKIIGSGSISDIGQGLKIGENTSFSENTFFGAAGGIVIGDDVIAGQNVRFHAENHNFSDREKLIREQGVNRKGIKIGNNCWIGAGATFLDGSEVGNGCIVAADAVVTKKFPDNSIIGGVPARLLKQRVCD